MYVGNTIKNNISSIPQKIFKTFTLTKFLGFFDKSDLKITGFHFVFLLICLGHSFHSPGYLSLITASETR